MTQKTREKSNVFTPIRAIGGVFVLAGVVLVCVPTLVYDPGPAENLFETIERRIPWGGTVGLGAFLLVYRPRKSWLLAVANLVFWLTLGALFARIVGLVLDGMGSAQQWLYVGIEIAVAGGIYVFMRSKNAQRSTPEREP